MDMEVYLFYLETYRAVDRHNVDVDVDVEEIPAYMYEVQEEVCRHIKGLLYACTSTRSTCPKT